MLLYRNHPENPERIKRIKAKLKEDGLYELCTELNSRRATKEELQLCHPRDYIDRIEAIKEKTREELCKESTNMDSVYYHWETYECASLAVGCLLSVLDDVCSGKSSNGVGVIRPPGHHANADSCSGFCFFNSIGIAARYAQKKYESIKKLKKHSYLLFFYAFIILLSLSHRVLILDFDVHHGNGTQDIFKEDDSLVELNDHYYKQTHFLTFNLFNS